MNEGFYLFKEGDPGNFFYIVKEGELELYFNSNEVKILRKGDSFGELALIHKNLRSGTIKSLTDVEVYCLEGNLFKEIILKMNNIDLKERIFFLSQNPIFRFLDPNQTHDIARNMLKCEFNSGQVISETDINDSLYIVLDGSVNCFYKNSNQIVKAKSKDSIGIASLLFSVPKPFLIVSESYSKCYQITKGLLIDTLGENYLNLILQSISKDAISKTKMIKILALEEYFSKVFKIFTLKYYEKSDVIFTNNNDDTMKKILIIIDGTITNVNFF